jgi:uncharacterized repeat protein (TIGR04042 family)
MPEMRFQIRWPDGQVDSCYSPSLVVREHLAVGASYPVPEFVARVGTALNIASERVRAKYGFACSMALDQLAVIESVASTCAPDQQVQVLAFDPSE